MTSSHCTVARAFVDGVSDAGSSSLKRKNPAKHNVDAATPPIKPIDLGAETPANERATDPALLE